jgi:hypothetical protein
LTLAELHIEARCAIAKGHGYIQVHWRRARSPKNWDRVRLAPGIYAKCIGEIERGLYLLDVPLMQFSTHTKGPAK